MIFDTTLCYRHKDISSDIVAHYDGIVWCEMTHTKTDSQTYLQHVRKKHCNIIILYSKLGVYVQ